MHPGDSIEVLEVVNTGGIFCACSSIPFFGGVGYLTKRHTMNRATDRVNSVIQHFKVKWVQFSIVAKVYLIFFECARYE